MELLIRWTISFIYFSALEHTGPSCTCICWSQCDSGNTYHRRELFRDTKELLLVQSFTFPHDNHRDIRLDVTGVTAWKIQKAIPGRSGLGWESYCGLSAVAISL